MSEVKLLVGEQQSKESSKAIQACNDYLRMGPGRSLRDLCQQYNGKHQNATPTQSFDTLAKWSTRYSWVERAELWDAISEERKTIEYDLAMKNGLALDYERVNSLKQLAGFLEDQIYEQGTEGNYHNVWLPDVKAVDGIKYDIERFNGAIFTQYRGTLEDLAKETGGRIAKQELGGIGGGPIQVEDVNETRQRLLASIQKKLEKDDAKRAEGVDGRTEQ